MVERNRNLRRLPSVDTVLAQEDVQALLARYPREVVVEGIRRALESRRTQLAKGDNQSEGPREKVPAMEVEAAIDRWMAPPLTRVINATGVILHTNLGRAPLAREAVSRLLELGGSYCNLELDLPSGRRGERMEAVREVLRERTGAEDVLVVNNNAAAVYLALRALADGKEAIVSRGELVEIGGSFRIPDVMQASGAHLIEVGTTNKTRLSDYELAIGPETALILVVHRSNFAQVGFTEGAPLSELAALAHSRSLPLVLDMGSGTLLDRPPPEWGDVPTVRVILDSGVDLFCFSGDKLLGGPQCGILLGRRALIEKLARDPMARALRVGKLTLVALGATLSLYRGGDAGARALPVVGMLFASGEELRQRAGFLLEAIGRLQAPLEAQIVPSDGQVGGGSMPLLALPGFGVAVKPRNGSAQALSDCLRRGQPAVLGRLHQNRVILDVRTVLGEGELIALAQAVGRAAAALPAVRPAEGGC